jgi:hypothetical protein
MKTSRTDQVLLTLQVYNTKASTQPSSLYSIISSQISLAILTL